MTKWYWVFLFLAGCHFGEERLTRSAPFPAGVLRIRVAQDAPAAGFQKATVADSDDPIYLNPTAELTETDPRRIDVWNGEGDTRILTLTFTDDGAAKMARATASNAGRRFAFVVDGRVITAPVIQSAITGGQAVIEGDFTKEEADRLATVLSGSK